MAPRHGDARPARTVGPGRVATSPRRAGSTRCVAISSRTPRTSSRPRPHRSRRRPKRSCTAGVRPGRGPPLRRTTRARGGPAVADRRRPPRPVPAGDRAASSHDRVHLDALVREEAQRFEEAAVEAGLHARPSTPPVPAVRGSARDLSLLVRNLIDNAIRYTKAGGTVVASVSADDGAVRLRVHRHGLGIPSTDLPRVFERFYRVDRARSRETGGTGPRLAIVRHVAENHGGTVSVESELGPGLDVRGPAAAARQRDARLTPSGARVCCRADDHALPDPSRAHRPSPARRSMDARPVCRSTTAGWRRPMRSRNGSRRSG